MSALKFYLLFHFMWFLYFRPTVVKSCLCLKAQVSLWTVYHYDSSISIAFSLHCHVFFRLCVYMHTLLCDLRYIFGLVLAYRNW